MSYFTHHIDKDKHCPDCEKDPTIRTCNLCVDKECFTRHDIELVLETNSFRLGTDYDDIWVEVAKACRDFKWEDNLEEEENVR